MESRHHQNSLILLSLLGLTPGVLMSLCLAAPSYRSI